MTAKKTSTEESSKVKQRQTKPPIQNAEISPYSGRLPESAQRAIQTPDRLSPAQVIQLQRTVGNQTVSRLLSSQKAQEVQRTQTQPISKLTSNKQIQRVPDIEATDEAMGQHIVDQVNAINAPRTAETGIHYPHNYQRMAQMYQQNPIANAGYKKYADFWKEDYWQGYANDKYFKRIGHMAWQLLPMVSASEGIKAWLKGPTIAECASSLVAIELDTMRAAMGDDKFDKTFSEWPTQQPTKGLLTITQYINSSSTNDFMEKTDEYFIGFGDKINDRTVKKGEWYYFSNHPKYLLKHPGGAFQGENAICMDDKRGEQKWSGFGVATVSESALMTEMARAYNAARTERDYEILLDKFAKDQLATKTNHNTYQSIYQNNIHKIPNEYRADKNSFPDQVSVQDIYDEPAYTIENVKRTGGFQSGGGIKLSKRKVEEIRNG